MPKATLTASAWRKSLKLWGFSYALGLGIGYAAGGLIGLLIAFILLASFQIICSYHKLGRILDQLESRALNSQPEGQGVWAALESLIYKKNREHRIRIGRLVQMLRGYRLAAGAMPEGALVVSRETGYIVWSNKTAKRMLGLHPGEEDANLFHLFDTDVKNWFISSDSEKPLLNVFSPGEHDAYLDFFQLPYTLVNSLVVLRDSTKMRRLEKMRSDFVANVSHELRTPLTVIHGYLELIEQQESPELQAIIGEMQKQSSRMNHLVEDLLNLSRLESGNMLPEEAISTGALLHTLQQEAVALSQGRHRISLVPDFNGLLICSPKDIHSAFSNLVSNAVRYTPTDGSITIGFRRNDVNGLDFWVQDTGFGIPADQISRLTERFYRVSTSRSRELGGTGLGLSICKHVLNLHQAELQIESTPGKGSRFMCRFPHERVA